MGRADYTDCMKPYMRGGGPERKERFCIGAKICSGKADNEDEAKRLCDEAAREPKPAKAPRARRGKKGATIDLVSLAACASQKINIEMLTPENLLSTLQTALESCYTGTKTVPALDYKKFMRDCIKVNTVTGSFKESGKTTQQCNINWKAQKQPVSA